DRVTEGDRAAEPRVVVGHEGVGSLGGNPGHVRDQIAWVTTRCAVELDVPHRGVGIDVDVEPALGAGVHAVVDTGERDRGDLWPREGRRDARALERALPLELVQLAVEREDQPAELPPEEPRPLLLRLAELRHATPPSPHAAPRAMPATHAGPAPRSAPAPARARRSREPPLRSALRR